MEENLYKKCMQCPRKCGANRAGGKKGFCGETDSLRIASAGLHFGEEPLVTVFGGSGTVFFTGCTLKCSFCQNYQISQQETGADVGEQEFVEICLKLQEAGAENINLVTGSHHIPKIAEFLKAAKKSGLKIPAAWNSSAYESTESLELLKDAVDIWLPDFKTLNSNAAEKLFMAKDYPERAKKAVSWMIKNFPLKIKTVSLNGEKKEKIERGVIIRHLALPGKIDDTILALEWLKKNADGKSCISLMSQYTPVPFCNSCAEEEQWRSDSLKNIENRLINTQEDETLRDIIEAYDFEWLFYQDLTNDTSWLPDFNRTQPFSNSLAKPLWHWKEKFLGS
ncbi:radical SAM protein [Treponema sp.]|uniref:radical SAM protein n=1 Tax=Treponema sp. TaxID=166 RepID=UPI003F0B720E